jgi:hypothetical protein
MTVVAETGLVKVGLEDRTSADDVEPARAGFEDSAVTGGFIVPDTGNPAMCPRVENAEEVLVQVDTQLAFERTLVCIEYVSSFPASRLEIHV